MTTGPTGPSQQATQILFGPTGPRGSAGVTGNTGPTGPTGADANFSNGGPYSPTTLSAPPFIIVNNVSLNSPHFLGMEMIIFQDIFGLVSYFPPTGASASLRASLPYVNVGPITFATIGKFLGFLTPGGCQKVIGTCRTGNNYVEFSYIADSGSEIIMNKDNVGSQIQLTYSIQFLRNS